ncbi:SMC-Scp complex subunit ScpB [candidate division FCPU426 bacterium]|nr:SMC-Scp complex subunit ScpB [candidate division FCPU426 bacterium]
MEIKELKSVIECLLFVSDKPMSLAAFQALLENVDRRTVIACLDELKAEYDMERRAFHLVEIAEGYQLATRVQYAPWIRKMFKSRAGNKLSRAALETLAIIAYRQPVTKAEIEDIRGVNADGVINALLERKLIRMVGRKEVVGRPILYGTTKEFLHYFGLKDLNEMPTLKDLQEILEADEEGQAWELNQQGELIARVKVADEPAETPAAGAAGGPDEAAPGQEAKAVTASRGESGGDLPEDVPENGNGKQNQEMTLASEDGDESGDKKTEDEDADDGDEDRGSGDQAQADAWLETDDDEDGNNGGHLPAEGFVEGQVGPDAQTGNETSDSLSEGEAGPEESKDEEKY